MQRQLARVSIRCFVVVRDKLRKFLKCSSCKLERLKKMQDSSALFGTTLPKLLHHKTECTALKYAGVLFYRPDIYRKTNKTKNLCCHHGFGDLNMFFPVFILWGNYFPALILWSFPCVSSHFLTSILFPACTCSDCLSALHEFQLCLVNFCECVCVSPRLCTDVRHILFINYFFCRYQNIESDICLCSL